MGATHRIMGSCHASKETKDPTDPNSRVPGTNLLPSCSIRSSLDPNKPGSTAHPEKANEDLSTPHTEAVGHVVGHVCLAAGGGQHVEEVDVQVWAQEEVDADDVILESWVHI